MKRSTRLERPNRGQPIYLNLSGAVCFRYAMFYSAFVSPSRRSELSIQSTMCLVIPSLISVLLVSATKRWYQGSGFSPIKSFHVWILNCTRSQFQYVRRNIKWSLHYGQRLTEFFIRFLHFRLNNCQ